MSDVGQELWRRIQAGFLNYDDLNDAGKREVAQYSIDNGSSKLENVSPSNIYSMNLYDAGEQNNREATTPDFTNRPVTSSQDAFDFAVDRLNPGYSEPVSKVSDYTPVPEYNPSIPYDNDYSVGAGYDKGDELPISYNSDSSINYDSTLQNASEPVSKVSSYVPTYSNDTDLQSESEPVSKVSSYVPTYEELDNSNNDNSDNSDNATISEWNQTPLQKLSDFADSVKEKANEFAYGLGNSTGGKLIYNALEKGIGQTPYNSGISSEDQDRFNKEYFMGKGTNWDEDTGDKVAEVAGNIAGDTLKMLGLGEITGGAASYIDNPILSKVVGRTLMGLGMGADETFENNSNASAGDYLTNMGRQALFMNAGGTASDLVGKYGTDLLNGASSAVKNSVAADLGLKALKGASFGTAGELSTLPTYNENDPNKPTAKSILTNAISGALFETIPGVVDTIKQTRESSSAIDNFKKIFTNGIENQYNDAVSTKDTNEALAKYNTILENIDNADNALTSIRLLGQNKKVADARDSLLLLKGFINDKIEEIPKSSNAISEKSEVNTGIVPNEANMAASEATEGQNNTVNVNIPTEKPSSTEPINANNSDLKLNDEVAFKTNDGKLSSGTVTGFNDDGTIQIKDNSSNEVTNVQLNKDGSFTELDNVNSNTATEQSQSYVQQSSNKVEPQTEEISINKSQNNTGEAKQGQEVLQDVESKTEPQKGNNEVKNVSTDVGSKLNLKNFGPVEVVENDGSMVKLKNSKGNIIPIGVTALDNIIKNSTPETSQNATGEVKVSSKVNTLASENNVSSEPTGDNSISYKPNDEFLVNENTAGIIKKDNGDGTYQATIVTPKGDVETTVKPNGKYMEQVINPTPKEQIHISDRTFGNVGNRKIKSYQYIHPELKSYIQNEAKIMQRELNDSTIAERGAIKDKEGNKVGNYGVSTQTSEGISWIKNQTGASYSDIGKALDNIITDHGAENTALAKKIELVIDDRLSNGYTDTLYTGMDIPANKDYVSMKSRIEKAKPSETQLKPSTENENSKSNTIEQNEKPLPQATTESKNEPLESKKGTEKEPATVKSHGNPQSMEVAKWVEDKLNKKEKISSDDLFKQAEKSYGSTLASGKLNVKDAYDSLELGVNQWLLHQKDLDLATKDINKVRYNADKLVEMMNNLPTQTKRTEETEEYQQFSTPPSIAYIANWIADINKNDTVLEPSAGIGGIATFAKIDGAKVIVNELSDRRLDILKNMGFDREFNENAEQINNILPDDVKPTVVVMNPPFSATAGRMKGKNNTKNAEAHIEQALKRLVDGGRLVAITGRGMSDNAPTFKNWWNEIKSQYNVRANIGLSGKNYTKYGTSFDIQVIVIDKNGPTVLPINTGFSNTLDDLINKLEEIENDRGQLSGPEKNKPTSAESNIKAVPTESEENSGHNTNIQLSANELGNKQSGSINQRAEGHQGINAGNTGEDNVAESEKADGLPGRSNTEGTNEPGNNTSSSRVSTGSLTNELDRAESSVKVDKLTEAEIKSRSKGMDLGDSVYAPYAPQKLKIKGAKPHLGNLSQSAAMAAVEPPDPTYTPKLPENIIKDGKLSIAQLESVVYAGQSHEQTLPNGYRRGYFIGDGTGVGKGRQISGIIMDNFNHGRKKAIWVSKNSPLYADAVRDWTSIGGNKDDVMDFGKVKPNTNIENKDGIMFATYGRLSRNMGVTPESGKISAIDQLIKWVGKDFDGIIAFDEAHNMANSIAAKGNRGMKKASDKALAGVDLQEKLPNARIVYVSATGATEVSNLAYADRLGLWGEGTPFADKKDFINKISQGGLAAMELVARDMKSMGTYIARSLSYDGVKYDKIEHILTPEQNQIYNAMAKGWQIVLQNINKALEVTSQNNNGNAKGRAVGQFWSSQQRFFNQVLTSMQMPSVIEDIKSEMAKGNAIVLQLVNTNQAGQDRQIAKSQEEEGSLDDLDLTPREALMQYLDKSFPVEQFEPYTDENGNERSRLVTDSDGKPVINKEALEMKNKLMEQLGSMKVPEGPLEILLNTFGPDNVAEITGRTRRVVKYKENGRIKTKIERMTPKTVAADVDLFMNGKKNILVFSDAGGTGKSYHADLTSKNQKHRIHYLIQAGWKADSAVQGFGRTHRTNEASAPTYKLVTTNLKGQKRFISSIARRLDQLGALTKGQRQTGSQGLFSSRDNLESPTARDSLERFYKSLIKGSYPDLDGKDILTKMGLYDKLVDDYGKINETPELRDITKFLNRLLVLEGEEQNKVFDTFSEVLDNMTDTAIKNGTLDVGLENFKADKVKVKEENVIRKDENTGAETKYVQLTASNKINPLKLSDLPVGNKEFVGFYQNARSKNIRAVFKGGQRTLSNGNVVNVYKLVGQSDDKVSRVSQDEFNSYNSNWKKLTESEAKPLWDEALKKVPEYKDENVHLITGTLLPVWDRLPNGNVRVMRVVTDDGEVMLGRLIPENDIDGVLRRLGASRTKEAVNSENVIKQILDDNYKVTLANGWELERRKVSGEYRIEILGDDLWKYTDELKKNGVFIEKIAYNTRYFVPTDDIAAEVFDKITKYRPVMDITSPEKEATTDHYLKSKPSNAETSEKEAKQTTNNSSYLKAPGIAQNVKKVFGIGKAKTIPEIIKGIGKDFNISITDKRFPNKGKWKQAVGIFQEHSESVVTRLADDLYAVTHELGHFLDKRYGFSRQYPRVIKEIIGNLPKEFASLYSTSELLGEAIAEFVRTYLTNPQDAEKLSQDFYDIFQKRLSSKDMKNINNAQKDISRWYSQSMEEKVGSTMVSHADRVHIPLSDKAQNAYVHIVDEMYGLEKVSNYAAKLKGEKLSPEKNPSVLAQNAKYSSKIAFQIFNENLLDTEGNIIGPSFKSVVQGVMKRSGISYEKLNDYLKSVHSLSWEEQGKKVFNEAISMDKVRDLINYDEAKYPELKEAAKEIHTWWNNFIQTWLVDTGLMDQGVWENMKEMYPNYVPLYRVIDKKSKDALPSSSRFSDLFNPVKKASKNGSTLETTSPIENFIFDIPRIVRTVKNREVMLALKDLEESTDGLGLFLRKVDAKSLPDTVYTGDIKAKLIKNMVREELNKLSDSEKKMFESMDYREQIEYIKNKGWNKDVDLVDGSINDMLQQWKVQRISHDKEVVSVIGKDGKQVWYQITDPYLSMALQSYNRKELGIVLTACKKLMHINKSLVASFNPFFGTISNLPRDFVEGYIYGKVYNPVKYVGQWLKALGDLIVNDKHAKAYHNAGGGGASLFTASPDCTVDMLSRIVPAYKIKHPLNVLINAIEKYNDAIEQTTRLAEFNRYDMSTYEGRTKGLYRSNEVTVNWLRKGDWAYSLDPILMFYNAGVQSLNKIARVMGSKDYTPAEKIGTLLKAIMVLTIPTLVLESMLRDDKEDDYEHLSNFIKDNYWVIPKRWFGIVDKTAPFIKIPKPRELNTIFGSSMRRRFDSQQGDKNAWKNFSENIYNNFLPVNSSIVSPFFQIGANKDWNDRPIVSGSLKNLPPESQYNEKTSTVGRAIANMMSNVPKGIPGIGSDDLKSPVKVDYLLKQYFGFISQAGLAATTEKNMNELKNGNVQSLVDMATEGFKQKVTADPAYSNDVMNQFYEYETKLQQQQQDYKQKSKLDYGYNPAVLKAFEQTAEQFTKINKMSDAIEKSNWSEDKKEQAIRNGKIYMLQTADKLNQGYEKYMDIYEKQKAKK